MRHENQHWDKIKAVVEIITAGVGQTGLSPTAAIQRLTDNEWLQPGGASWGAGFAVNTMTAVDATNLPGLYSYSVPLGRLSYQQGLVGYRIKIVEATNSILEYVTVTGTRSELDELMVDHIVVGSAGETLANISVSGIATAVWDELYAGHVVAGSFGLLVQIIRGLVQGNHRLKSPTYDANGRLLTAQLAVYPTSADALNDTSPLATFTMTCTYDGFGNLNTLLSRE